MDFNEYQKESRKLNIYPNGSVGFLAHTLGICDEAGEVAGKVKKQIRDKKENFTTKEFRGNMKAELGDVLWYIANTAKDLGITLEDIANYNIEKLKDRKNRGVLGGSGDER